MFKYITHVEPLTVIISYNLTLRCPECLGAHCCPLFLKSFYCERQKSLPSQHPTSFHVVKMADLQAHNVSWMRCVVSLYISYFRHATRRTTKSKWSQALRAGDAHCTAQTVSSFTTAVWQNAFNNNVYLAEIQYVQFKFALNMNEFMNDRSFERVQAQHCL